MRLRYLLGSKRLRLTVALLFFIFGTVALVSSLTGATRVQWTGHSARGRQVGDVVYFSYHGQTYLVKKPSRFLSDTVYFDPAHPAATAMLGDSTERAIEEAAVVVPYAIALTITALAVLRARRRHRKHVVAAGNEFGHGLSQDFVQRQLNNLRRPESLSRARADLPGTTSDATTGDDSGGASDRV